jgi:hypothetical protein
MFLPDMSNPSQKMMVFNTEELERPMSAVFGTSELANSMFRFSENLSGRTHQEGCFYHEVLVFVGDSWFWSFEKYTKYIQVQRFPRAMGQDQVMQMRAVRDDTANGFHVENRNSPRMRVESTAVKVQTWLLLWTIGYWSELKMPYNILTGNCQVFAEGLAEAARMWSGERAGSYRSVRRDL